VYITNSGSASVSIPANTKLSGTYNDTLYDFFTATTNTIDAGATSGIAVTEGVKVEKQLVTSGSNGQIGQRYTLSGTNITPSSVRVFVLEDGVTEVEWTKATNVNTLPANTAGFSVYVSTDEEVEIVFGNRLSGRIPPVGATIKATYTTCSGAAGNVPANTVKSFANAYSTTLSVGNSSSFTAGSDSESVASIKRSLKAVVRTQERAVTLQDFVDYANLVNGVYRASASYSASAGTVTVYPFPFISAYPSYTQNSASVPASVVTEIQTTLAGVALLGVTVAVASSITVNKVNITATIYVKPTHVATSVLANVTNALDGLFELDVLDFGKEVRIGDAYRVALAVEGVDYITIGTLEMKTPADVTIAPGALSAVQFLRKGTYTLTTSGGITTSV
jgi:predicted phage baseplate assembly protein